MNQAPNIAEAEWDVMKICRLKPYPCTANEIYASLQDSTDWKPNTVKTLITYLVKKQALCLKQEHRVYYYPLVSQAACVRSETKSFVNQVFGGAAQPILVTFLPEETLSRSEIEELKKILEEKEG